MCPIFSSPRCHDDTMVRWLPSNHRHRHPWYVCLCMRRLNARAFMRGSVIEEMIRISSIFFLQYVVLQLSVIFYFKKSRHVVSGGRRASTFSDRENFFTICYRKIKLQASHENIINTATMSWNCHYDPTTPSTPRLTGISKQ